MCEKKFYFILNLSAALLLAACAQVTQRVQAHAARNLAQQIEFSSSQNETYPESIATDQGLITKPPTVNLSHYQNVQARPKNRPDIAIAIAASGGGYRAANFTAGVMQGLESLTFPGLKGNLLQEVDYYSTISGSGLAVGTYITGLYNHLHENLKSEFSYTQYLQNLMQKKGSENPLAKDYTHFLFFYSRRGDAMENSLDKNIFKTYDNRSLTFGDIYTPNSASPSEVKLPFWVTNSTIYQNANLFPFTPDVLSRYKVSRYPHNFQLHYTPGLFSDEKFAYNMPVALATTASLSVPFALPPITLASEGCPYGPCYLQLMDGGLVDNLGMQTALDLLRQDKAPIKVLIIIDAFNGSEQPYSENPTPPSDFELLWRVIEFGTDAPRQQLRTHVEIMSKDILCASGANNVLIVYLDLSHYAEARRLGTGLYITQQEQRLMQEVGKKSILANSAINDTLKKLANGNLHEAQCRGYF